METLRVSSASIDEAADAFMPFFPGMGTGPSRGAPFRRRIQAHTIETVGMIEYSSGGRETPVPERAPARLLDIDQETVDRFARADLGIDDFHVVRLGIAPMSRDLGATWNTVSSFVAQRMRDGTADLPLVGAALSDLLVSTFLNTFPTTWSDARRRGDGTAPTSTAVRRAQVFMDEHLGEPLTTSDIAQAARMSVRWLSSAFRRELGMTAMQYLRRVRLDHAHRALLASDRSDVGVVARIAAASGFTHASRFAAAYRDEFGELPSQTQRS